MDRIEYYPDFEIRDWLDRFSLTDALYLPDIPFSYLEVRAEWQKRVTQKERTND